MKPKLNRILAPDAHHRLLVGLGVALSVVALASATRWPVRILLAWNSFAFSIIALSWMRIVFADAKTSVREARLQDSSRTAIFVFVNFAALASLLAVGLLFRSTDGTSAAVQPQNALLAGATVILSWLLTHTLFTLHYAHLFYRASDQAPDRTDGEGLEFPGEKHPDFLDFAYFSFVIGMTCQVSDVQVTSRRVRRVTLLHGVLAFVFNTVILAWTINLAAGVIR